MNMSCDDELLQMYVDGDMGPVERAIIDHHLKDCPSCRQRVLEYKGLLWDLEHPAPEETPPELAALSDRLMAAWEEARSAPEPAPASWQEASLIWTQAVPGVQTALGAAGRVGRSLPKAGLTGLGYLARRVLRGGDRR
jgi:anti-sigma factor RsiW